MVYEKNVRNPRIPPKIVIYKRGFLHLLCSRRMRFSINLSFQVVSLVYERFSRKPWIVILKTWIVIDKPRIMTYYPRFMV